MICDICLESEITVKTDCNKDMCKDCISKVTICPFCRRNNFVNIPYTVSLVKFSEIIYNSKYIGKQFVILPKESDFSLSFSYYKTYYTKAFNNLKLLRTYASAYMGEPILEFIYQNEDVHLCLSERRFQSFNCYLIESEFDVIILESKFLESNFFEKV